MRKILFLFYQCTVASHVAVATPPGGAGERAGQCERAGGRVSAPHLPAHQPGPAPGHLEARLRGKSVKCSGFEESVVIICFLVATYWFFHVHIMYKSRNCTPTLEGMGLFTWAALLLHEYLDTSQLIR